MFKLKVNKLKRKETLSVLSLVETTEYKYVLSDDTSLFEEDKINILINEHNLLEIKNLIKYTLRGEDVYINVENSFGVKRINVRVIEYIEALDNDVFVVFGKERYYVLEKLYVLESLLESKNFVRVSKSFIVNLGKIDYIKPLINSKLKLIMNNGDTIEVNRTYIKSFKERMKL